MDRRLLGSGQNVAQMDRPVTGTVRYLAKPADVISLMRDPAVSSTVILTRGGAATFAGAVLPKRPAGVITLEGAPESHLGIVSREFRIPAIMSVVLSDGEADRFGPTGLMTDAYIGRVLDAIDGVLVEIDCKDPVTGHVYLAS